MHLDHEVSLLVYIQLIYQWQHYLGIAHCNNASGPKVANRLSQSLIIFIINQVSTRQKWSQLWETQPHCLNNNQQVQSNGLQDKETQETLQYYQFFKIVATANTIPNKCFINESYHNIYNMLHSSFPRNQSKTIISNNNRNNFRKYHISPVGKTNPSLCIQPLRIWSTISKFHYIHYFFNMQKGRILPKVTEKVIIYVFKFYKV
eukprot:TRINITY_DN1865_c0_g1_i2.p2 TRINITY_DN1865_c0_g1~~TRINITY_DN1865_c0_g1_i2.p2  ORF type:complete len:204 (+),score=-27.99 TRINITY_DN1865_c0_g1_i2:1861-2472(+)